MEKIVICGGKPLQGRVNISGAKNAALAIIPATLLVEGVCRLENLPNIGDVAVSLELLESLGATVRYISPGTVEIDTTRIAAVQPPKELVRRIRTSYYLVGAMLSRFGKATVALPGGCDLGVRPIDQHIKAFEALGARVNIHGGCMEATTVDGLVGTSIYMDVSSVGATINAMLAAVKASGQTVIENAAKEPHVVDTANFLNLMGANIKGAGTATIKVTGVHRLRGGIYANIPDMIEAGTYLVAAAATKGDVTVCNVIPKHLESTTAKLEEIGLGVEEMDDAVRVYWKGELNRTNVKALPYPGFPTDMQPQITALLCLVKGTSIVTEGVWDSRFRYTEELQRMGARISVDGKVAVVEGQGKLSGATVRPCDLRAGAALVIAGLGAEGVTMIEEIGHIERGYENMVGKLQALGADICKIESADDGEPAQLILA